MNGKLKKEVKKSTKLDFKTWLYLYITHAVRIEHPPVIDVEDKKTMYVKDSKKMKYMYLEITMNIKITF